MAKNNQEAVMLKGIKNTKGKFVIYVLGSSKKATTSRKEDWCSKRVTKITEGLTLLLNTLT